MSDFYVIGPDGEPIGIDDVLVWGEWFEHSPERQLALTIINEVRISTVFLGLDHNFSGKGPPVLWETMVFAIEAYGWLDLDCHRYTSRVAALAGHEAVCETVRLQLGEYITA